MSQLPHLLRLLDDDSSSMRQRITKELEAFGHSLEEEIYKRELPVNNEQKRLLQPIFE